MSVCERKVCAAVHDGSYGSGRFCSKKCARGSSTDDKRKEINERVSNALRRPTGDTSSDELFREIVSVTKTWRQLARNLNLSQDGSVQMYLRRRVKQLSIDISHFKPHKKKIHEILCYLPNQKKPHIRTALLKTGREYKCEECSCMPTWQGKPLTLSIDHINGDRYDHRQENLRFLCPNCHSQTATFAGRNIVRKREGSNPSLSSK